MKNILITCLAATILFATARAQPVVPGSPESQNYKNFTPSMAIMVVILITVLFFMGVFSLYIGRCAGGPPNVAANARPNIAALLIGRSRRAFVGNRGLDSATIETFPTFTYSAVKGLKIGKGALECAVCITEFEDDETLRLLPRCDHVFHTDCIDAWLSSHVTCPVCRANLSLTTEGDDSVPVDEVTDDTLSTVEGDDMHNSVSIRVMDDQNMDDHDHDQVQQVPRDGPDCINHSRSMNQNRPSRSRSIKSIIFSRFPRSHSTGHSLVQPGENVDRFRLNLPAGVRKEIMNRALNRATSLLVMPSETSSRRGYRTDGIDGRGKVYRRLQSLEPVKSKSDRWIFRKAPSFLTRESSIKTFTKSTISENEGNSSITTSRNFINSLKKSFGRLNSKDSESSCNESTKTPV